MTRYLTVTCTRQRCNVEGLVELRDAHAEALPPGWLIVAYSYDGGSGMEFCSLACLEQWAAAMQKAHQRQREWQERKAS